MTPEEQTILSTVQGTRMIVYVLCCLVTIQITIKLIETNRVRKVMKDIGKYLDIIVQHGRITDEKTTQIKQAAAKVEKVAEQTVAAIHDNSAVVLHGPEGIYDRDNHPSRRAEDKEKGGESGLAPC